MKTILSLALIAGGTLTFSACESDEVSPTVQTTTTTEETVVQQPASGSTTETRTIRSY